MCRHEITPGFLPGQPVERGLQGPLVHERGIEPVDAIGVDEEDRPLARFHQGLQQRVTGDGFGGHDVLVEERGEAARRIEHEAALIRAVHGAGEERVHHIGTFSRAEHP